jgi:hypothetical protein
MPIVLNLIATEIDTRTHPKGGKQLGTMSEFTDDLREESTTSPLEPTTVSVCESANQTCGCATPPGTCRTQAPSPEA